jgi:AcrR family transcriptional regulator
MSEKQYAERKTIKARKMDARIRGTHQRLGMALMELILVKPLDSITVQEVLDRASVGRSTFYLHFRDKNDLLLSQLEMFLETMSTMLSARKEASHRLVPVTEMFNHVGGQKKIYRALSDSGRLYDFFDLAQGYFARGIEQRLAETNHPANASERERTHPRSRLQSR